MQAIIKAQNREGLWFELETDAGLQEAIEAARGKPVHLFFVLSEVDEKGIIMMFDNSHAELLSSPRAWLNANEVL